ncbi:hypothetical protein R6Q59_018712 [Mikania micrantha]
MKTSLPFRSENLWRKSGFKFPETTRLYSQREYAAPKIIPSAANVATKLFLWKAPTKMRNSPIKLLVPVVNDEFNVSQETQDFYCDLVVNLGPLLMRAPLSEGVDDKIFIDDDEVEYDDEEKEKDDDEDEEDEDVDDDEIDKHYCSDDFE